MRLCDKDIEKSIENTIFRFSIGSLVFSRLRREYCISIDFPNIFPIDFPIENPPK